eukprot:681340-Amphidinium_carterae.1
MQAGDIYRELLPKAIVEVTEEHGFDHSRLRVRFRLRVRGETLMAPEACWQFALRLGADLVDTLPPKGRPGDWRKRGVTVDMEEAAWQTFKRRYMEACASRPSLEAVERKLSRMERNFNSRMAVALKTWQRQQQKLETMNLKRIQIRKFRCKQDARDEPP